MLVVCHLELELQWQGVLTISIFIQRVLHCIPALHIIAALAAPLLPSNRSTRQPHTGCCMPWPSC
jgi:hypothetical protein